MNQSPSILRQIAYHTILFLISVAVLYPVLWVVKIAMTPETSSSIMDPWPFPSTTDQVDKEYLLPVDDNPLKYNLLYAPLGQVEIFTQTPQKQEIQPLSTDLRSGVVALESSYEPTSLFASYDYLWPEWDLFNPNTALKLEQNHLIVLPFSQPKLTREQAPLNILQKTSSSKYTYQLPDKELSNLKLFQRLPAIHTKVTPKKVDGQVIEFDSLPPQTTVFASYTRDLDLWENFEAVIFATGKDDNKINHWLLGNWLFGIQLFNSLVISLITACIGLAFSCTAAYAMSRFVFPGKDAGMSFFLVTQMFPGVVMAIPLYILMSKLNLLNSSFGLALVYSATAVPFCTWNLKGYFDTIPKDIEDAARMDGASQWVIFTKIVLPLSKPALAVTALFSFMTAWNEFILAATFISDKTAYTLPVLLNSFVGAQGTEWGKFAAGAIIASLPVVILFFILQKHLVEGLTAGAVK